MELKSCDDEVFVVLLDVVPPVRTVESDDVVNNAFEIISGEAYVSLVGIGIWCLDCDNTFEFLLIVIHILKQCIPRLVESLSSDSTSGTSGDLSFSISFHK